jgi:sugar phosphate isomerase/epimerase
MRTELFAQTPARRIPLGIQYGAPGDTPDANKAKMEGFKALGYDLIEPVNMRGFDPKLFRKQAEDVGLQLRSIHITTSDTSAPPPRGQGAGPGVAPGGGGRVGGGQPGGGAPGGGRGNQQTVYAKNGRPLHSFVAVQQDTMYNNQGILEIVKAQAPILRDLGVTYGVLGASSFTSYSTVDGLKRMADVYNEAHKILRAVGVNLSFHTHEWELWPVPDDGRMGLDLVLQNTDPGIKAQIDIGWAAWGGADVVSLVRSHAARIGLLHMRDYKDGAVTTAGEGVFNWPEIFKVTMLIKDALCYVEGGDAAVAATDLRKFGWGRA